MLVIYLRYLVCFSVDIENAARSVQVKFAWNKARLDPNTKNDLTRTTSEMCRRKPDSRPSCERSLLRSPDQEANEARAKEKINLIFGTANSTNLRSFVRTRRAIGRDSNGVLVQRVFPLSNIVSTRPNNEKQATDKVSRKGSRPKESRHRKRKVGEDERKWCGGTSVEVPGKKRSRSRAYFFILWTLPSAFRPRCCKEQTRSSETRLKLIPEEQMRRRWTEQSQSKRKRKKGRKEGKGRKRKERAGQEKKEKKKRASKKRCWRRNKKFKHWLSNITKSVRLVCMCACGLINCSTELLLYGLDRTSPIWSQ